ncbi:histone deacetylase family protein [Tropicimonas sediminicola]|uniref:Acetoin utilization deacetylase AcuC n=1 Tax=Tropicimonas sediminicola TaxID=1031541 RepID=A0A239J3V0_9RHOB|nr:histone deacetylase family protein [Tropicimonas sediminicola]SNT00479.1 Acetoin utilization deacetylase AcuC [Tropicimonas sediminicola]
MTTALFTHPDCLGHVTPEGHPERVSRLESVLAALAGPEFDALDRREAPLAERSEILRAHPEAQVAFIEASIPAEGWVSLDADTHVMAGSMTAALRAAGANVAAVDAVLAGEVTNAFCAIRPPGHHAERTMAMGFCLFDSIAIAAKRALDHHGLTRVAIVDFDVHHGNGTQDILWNEPRVLFASTHQMPLYPGSGSAHETGAHGNIINVPLPPGAGGAAFRRAMEGQILPALEDFAPELVLVSAGFDAHVADPLAQLNFTAEDFAWATEQICALARRHCGGRVVSTLEGGYDLEALAACTAAHVKVLMEQGG